MYQVSHILRDSEQPDYYWEIDYRHPNAYRTMGLDGTPYPGHEDWGIDEVNLFDTWSSWPTYTLEELNIVLENE